MSSSRIFKFSTRLFGTRMIQTAPRSIVQGRMMGATSHRQHGLLNNPLQRHLPIPSIRYWSASAAASSSPLDQEEEDGGDTTTTSPKSSNNTTNQQQQQQQHHEQHHEQHHSLDAFRVLHLERKFDLSMDEIKQSYRNLMAHLHPDKHHLKTHDEQTTLRQQASEVTQSYQMLKDPTTRATHLLQLLGHVDDDAVMEEMSLQDLLNERSSSNNNNNNNNNNSFSPNELLLEIMEIREAIDDVSSEEELQSLRDENNARMEDVCAKLAKAFDDDPKNLDRALELAVILQYYSRIDETIRDKMDS